MKTLNFGLRRLKRVRKYSILNRLVFWHTEFFHQPFDALSPENTHQIVFHGNKELRGARIPLSACPPPQLVVYSPSFVAFGANYMQATHFFHFCRLLLAWRIPAQDNIHTATSHIGCHGYSSQTPGLRNNLRFLFMVFCVENVMGNSFCLEQFAEILVFLYRHGAHKQGLALFVPRFNFPDHGAKFSLFCTLN